jgi:dCMP deaminase
MKQKWVDAFMDTAERFAQLSSAKRLQVGAVVVKDERITSIGYNGTPAGWDNNCEYVQVVEMDNKFDQLLKTKPEVIHAEANAISKLAKSSESGEGSSIFITHAPCVECAKLIYGAGITKVYYRTAYRDSIGIDFLAKCNIEVEQV